MQQNGKSCVWIFSVLSNATKFLLVPALASILSCSTGTYYPVSFVDFEYEPFNRKGTGKVRGSLLQNGSKKIGNKVYLTPMTSLSKQMIDEGVLNGKVPEVTVDSRQSQYVQMTQADGNGMFTFENLTSGTYYVYATQSDLSVSLDLLLRIRKNLETVAVGSESVEVENGKTTEVILNMRSSK